MNSDLLFITNFNFRPVDVHSVGDLSVKILTERSQDLKLEDLWVLYFRLDGTLSGA